MNKTYELNPNEELTIKSPVSLKSYEINSDILKNNNTIRLNFNLKGTYIIKFSNKDLDITDNIISGHEFLSLIMFSCSVTCFTKLPLMS